MNFFWRNKEAPVQIGANVSFNKFTDFIMRRDLTHSGLQQLVRDVFNKKPKKDEMIEIWSNYPQNFDYYNYFKDDHMYQLAKELGNLNTSTAKPTNVPIHLQNVLAESLAEFAFDHSKIEAEQVQKYRDILYLDQARRKEVWQNKENTVLFAKHYDNGKTSVIIFVFIQEQVEYFTFSATVHHENEDPNSFEIYQIFENDPQIEFWEDLVSKVKVKAWAEELELKKQEEAEAEVREQLRKLAEEEDLARRRAHELTGPERRLYPSAPPVNNGNIPFADDDLQITPSQPSRRPPHHPPTHHRDNVQDPDLMVTAPVLLPPEPPQPPQPPQPPKPPPRPVHPAPAVHPPPPGPPVRPPAGVEPHDQVLLPPNSFTTLIPDARHENQPHSPGEHDNSRPFLWEWRGSNADLEELWRIMVLPVLKKPAHEKEVLMRHLLPLVGRELFGIQCDDVHGIETKIYNDDGPSTRSHHHVMGNTNLGKLFIVYRRDNTVRFLYQGPSNLHPLNVIFVTHTLEFYLELFFNSDDTTSASDSTDENELVIGQYPLQRAIEVPVAEAVVPRRQNDRVPRRTPAPFNDGEQSTVPYDPPPRNNPVESQPLAPFDDRAQSPIPHYRRSQWQREFDDRRIEQGYVDNFDRRKRGT